MEMSDSTPFSFTNSSPPSSRHRTDSLGIHAEANQRRSLKRSKPKKSVSFDDMLQVFEEEEYEYNNVVETIYDTRSVSVQLSAETKITPIVPSAKPTFIWSAVLLVMTIVITKYVAFVTLDCCQPTIEIVDSQPTVDNLFSLTQEQVPEHFQRFNLEEMPPEL
jgi:hypothetical protein